MALDVTSNALDQGIPPVIARTRPNMSSNVTELKPCRRILSPKTPSVIPPPNKPAPVAPAKLNKSSKKTLASSGEQDKKENVILFGQLLEPVMNF